MKKMLITKTLIRTIAGFAIVAGIFSVIVDRAEALGPPPLAWEAAYPEGIGRSVQQTSDGGYIMLGKTDTLGAGMGDMYLVKADADGVQEWASTFGGPNPDSGYSVQQTDDGGYILLGYTQTGGPQRMFLVKVDANGNEEWENTHGGPASSIGLYVEQTTDSGFILVGIKGNSGYVVKTDNSGNEQWSTTIPYCQLRSGQQTSDGGYIVVGGNYGNVNLVKLSASGVQEWIKTTDPEPNEILYARSVRQTEDQGFIALALVDNVDPNAPNKTKLIKTDSSGVNQWTSVLNGPLPEAVRQHPDGGYLVIGTNYTVSTGYDMYLEKTDSGGSGVWSATYDDGGVGDQGGYSLDLTSDGGLALLGYTQGSGNYEFYLVKTDKDGNL